MQFPSKNYDLKLLNLKNRNTKVDSLINEEDGTRYNHLKDKMIKVADDDGHKISSSYN